MDTIRMKIHLLKVETSDTINRLLSMETAATRNTQLVKDRELKLRQLMKGVSQKENGETFELPTRKAFEVYSFFQSLIRPQVL